MNLWAIGTSWYHEVPDAERWPAWYDSAALWASSAFFHGKFHSLFTLLFRRRIHHSTGAPRR
jgi:uncharacterized membrane protein YeiB